MLLRRHDLAEVQRSRANTKVGNTDLACTKAEFAPNKMVDSACNIRDDGH